MDIARGQRVGLADFLPNPEVFSLDAVIDAPGLSVDVACFSLNAAEKLSDERYMTFFNQPVTPCGAVALESGSAAEGRTSFRFALAKLPADIHKLVVTAAIDGPGVMSDLRAGSVTFRAGGTEKARFNFRGADFARERALMLGELYRKDGIWRFFAVGQGFNGGLAALVQHFGGEVAEKAPPPAAPSPSPAPPANSARVSLDKRIEREAPQLVSLVKAAGVSLEKVGLSGHRAKVALCLDISASMSGLYRQGVVQQFAERLLALACRFDDDGEIDVFLFGERGHHPNPMNLSNCSAYIRQLVSQYPLEGGTNYTAAMRPIRSFYRGTKLPVYVMFVTDGNAGDGPLAERELIEASREPIFWQFMGVSKEVKLFGKKLSFLQSNFAFLAKLDDLPGRFLDNADCFVVESPMQYPDEELYALLMQEYPGWVRQARAKGLI